MLSFEKRGRLKKRKKKKKKKRRRGNPLISIGCSGNRLI
jgi:hypothetical protein